MAERDPAKGPEIDTSGIYDTSLSFSSHHHKKAKKGRGPAAMTAANSKRRTGAK